MQEIHLYGSSRLGTYKIPYEPDPNDNTKQIQKEDFHKLILGRRNYELSNHLGNVLAVISDKKILNGNTFEADIVSANDYYPFGMTIALRMFQSEEYRFGFNGKENDKDFGEGIQDYGMRISDRRIARFLSMDPLTSFYPWYTTPYQFAGNKPIQAIDLDGLEELDYNKFVEGMIKGQSKLRHAPFPHGETGYNTLGGHKDNPFWEVGPFGTNSIQTKDGVKPSDAIKHIIDNAEKYPLDCGQYVQVLKLNGYLNSMGEQEFNKYINSISEGQFLLKPHGSTGINYVEVYQPSQIPHEKELRVWYGSTPGSALANFYPEEFLKTAKVGTEINFSIDFLSETVFHNENAIKVGKNKYLAQIDGADKVYTLKGLKQRLVEEGISRGTLDPSERKKALDRVKIVQIKVTSSEIKK